MIRQFVNKASHKYNRQRRTENRDVSLDTCRVEQRRHDNGKVRFKTGSHSLTDLCPRPNEIVLQLRIGRINRTL